MTWPLGVATGCCSESPILEVLDAIEEAGFAGVEFGTPPHHFTPWEPSEVAAVEARMRTLACTPVSMHAPFGGLLDLAHHSAESRRAAIDTAIVSARALKRLGGSVLVVHPTDHVRAHHDVGPRLAWCTDALRIITDVATGIGVQIAIETPLPHLIGGHPDEFAAILERVGPAARICLDTGHTHLGGFTQRFIELAGDRLIHVHLHDNRGHFDDHLVPGDGTIDWPRVFTLLERARYAGWLMLELKGPAGSLVEYLRRARQQAETRAFGL